LAAIQPVPFAGYPVPFAKQPVPPASQPRLADQQPGWEARQPRLFGKRTGSPRRPPGLSGKPSGLAGRQTGLVARQPRLAERQPRLSGHQPVPLGRESGCGPDLPVRFLSKLKRGWGESTQRGKGRGETQRKPAFCCSASSAPRRWSGLVSQPDKRGPDRCGRSKVPLTGPQAGARRAWAGRVGRRGAGA